MKALVQIASDPDQRIDEFFGASDGEYLEDCMALLEATKDSLNQ